MADSHYVLPLNILLGRCGLSKQLNDGSIELTQDQLFELIRGLLTSIVVDEEWYQVKYPDVAEAVKAGLVRSAKEHFIRSGYFEGRRPGKVLVDDEFYVATYPDAAEGIEFGDFVSAQEHFERHGWTEGRLPYEIEK
jgi:hypothetical protein